MGEEPKKLITTVSAKDTIIILIPGIIEFIVFSGLFLLPSETKINLSQDFQFDIFRLVYIFSSLLFTIFYAFKILRAVKKHKNNVLNCFSNTEKKLLDWIRYVALFIIIYYGINFVFFSFVLSDKNIYSDYTYALLSFINVIFIYWVGINGLRQPVTDTLSICEDEPQSSTKKSKNNTNATESNNTSIYTNLLTLIKREKPYKNPDLTLVMLAKEMNISREILSKTINQNANINFNGFINRYRIEEAKSLLSNSKYDYLNMNGIASESGFNTKSTFFSIFKKHTGLTPNQYKKQITS